MVKYLLIGSHWVGALVVVLAIALFCVRVCDANKPYPVGAADSGPGLVILERVLEQEEDPQVSALGLRDIFSYRVAVVEAGQDVGRVGLRLAGFVLGQRPGIVLEGAAQADVVFLSLGETKGALSLVRLDRHGAVVSNNGQEIILEASSEGR